MNTDIPNESSISDIPLKTWESNLRPVQQGFDKVTFCDHPRIVILEDDTGLAYGIKTYLEKKINANIELFTNSRDFLEQFISRPGKQPFCFLTDISLGKGHDGLFILDLLKERNLPFFCIVMTGFASIETAISATKKGVFHYLTKPFELEQLHKLMIDGFAKSFKMIIKKDKLIQVEDKNGPVKKDQVSKNENIVALEEIKESDIFCGLISRSKEMQIIFDRIKKVASSKSSVLIQGESGTGKKLMAQAIHQLSSRNMQKLYSINCRSIPEELLESELFGHIQGAFNGAISDRKGRLELANGSSLFIEEINALPIFIQIKLLKVLQSKMMEPMGGHHGKAIDVRYVVSSLRNLEDEVKNQNFREDLYYRLNVIPINIVPLRERKDDISILISYFLKKYVSADQSNHISFSQKAYQVLLNYDWPGNVRELESLIERLVILKGGTIIRPEDLPGKLYKDNPLSTSLYKNLFQLPDNGIRLKQVLSDIEESLILQAINRTNGNKNKASKLLGLNRTTLIEKLKKRGIQFS